MYKMYVFISILVTSGLYIYKFVLVHVHITINSSAFFFNKNYNILLKNKRQNSLNLINYTFFSFRIIYIKKN